MKANRKILRGRQIIKAKSRHMENKKQKNEGNLEFSTVLQSFVSSLSRRGLGVNQQT